MSKRIESLEKRIANRKERIKKYRENIKKEKASLKADEQTLLNAKYNEILKKLLKYDVDPKVIDRAIEEDIKQKSDTYSKELKK